MAGRNGKNRKVGPGKETILPLCTQLQIQEQFINPSLHEIKKIKADAEKAAGSFLPLQWDTLHRLSEPTRLFGSWTYSLCVSHSSLTLPAHSCLWCGFSFQIYTITHLYMHIALVFSITPEPHSSCQSPSPTWARNCEGTETKASLQTPDCASGRELSRVPMFFRWRKTQISRKSCTNKSVTEGVRKAYRSMAYSHSDRVLLPGKCSVKLFVSSL